ncbi:MAG: nitroreductase family deazaflavin-dependent oxidoreductase [Acidimicrobiia bacterium]
MRPFAIVIHTGRRTGRNYRTPVWAFEDRATVVIALTYGRQVDWARNLMAAGGGRIELRGDAFELIHPRLAGDDAAGPFLPWAVRGALGLLGVHEYLMAERA